jgi:hypothetical protein
VGRLEECLGEVLPLQTDDLLKDYAKDARNSMASAIEQLSLARAKKSSNSEAAPARDAHYTDSTFSANCGFERNGLVFDN